MSAAFLEHVNFTVGDAEATAQEFCELFGWHIRWKGDSIHDGYSVHVGTDDNYLAVYSPREVKSNDGKSYWRKGGLNHIGVVVDDLDAVEAKVLEAGYKTHSHADYEPGRRFYFHNKDDIEIEVVSYN